MMTPGVLARLVAVALLALPLIPVQWLAVRFALPMMRTLPVAFHRGVSAILGLRATIVGRPAAERPLLIVANHVSWLDIVVLSAILPVSFVAKSEIASWPVFGLFARLQRSIFVERSRRASTAATAAEMGARLAAGDAVVLFAEGTSSDGNRTLPFRSALIGATRHAIAAEGGQVCIQPVSIAYTGLHGMPIGRERRPRVAWYGNMAMGPHLIQVMRSGPVSAVVTFGEPLSADALADRKRLTREAERAVRVMTAWANLGRPSVMEASRAA